jgi:hypothetical protein
MKSTRSSLLRAATLGLAAVLPFSALGGSLEALSNPVPNGAIVTSAGNNDRSDWAVVTPFAVDPDESRVTDWQQVSWAHDATNFFVRLRTFRTGAGGFLTWQEKLMLDTDQSRDTGYHGNFLPIGVEYLIEGSTLYQFTGTAPDQWSWTVAASLLYDDWPLNDQELTLPRNKLGEPAGFAFFLLAESDGLDYYPDSAPAPAGGYFTYSTVPVQCRLSLAGTPPSFYWITGQGPDGTYVVEASTDLRNWTAISTNETASGEFLCVPPADGAQQKFFRAYRQ